ncbi:hypothetical protein ACFE04_003408 [Oxalis oulophora]
MDQRKEFVEDAFKETQVPSWGKQITFRAMGTSFLLSIVFNFIVCKLTLTTGVIPSLNVAAGLLGFAILKSWTTLLMKGGFLKQPFTRQENTVIQTCVVASSGIAFSSTYPAPYGKIYRGIALVGVQGTKSLPDYCVTLSVCFFFGAILVNLITMLLKKCWLAHAVKLTECMTCFIKANCGKLKGNKQ